MKNKNYAEKNLPILGSSRKRVDFIDVTRGLLIIWMIVSHAIGRAKIPDDHVLQLLRPHGWATFGFVMVSGFSIGFLFKWTDREDNVLHKKLWKRALQIGAAAYFSNLIFISAKLFLEKNMNFEIFYKIALFQYPWGYSAILIPTTFLLLISPWLLKTSANNSSSVLLILSSAIVTIVSIFVAYFSDSYLQYPIFQILFARNQYVVFPIGYLFLYAIWAFTFASWIKKYQQQREILFIVLAISVAIYITAYSLLPYDSYNPNSLVVISRFPIIIFISIIICTLSFTLLLRDGLGLIGRSALLVYIIHRPILEAVDLLFNTKIAGVELAAFLMLFAVFSSLLICYLKENNQRLSFYLRKIGL